MTLPLVATLALLVQAAPPPKAAPRTVRMEPAVVIDATGFEKPMAAATLFVPHGWRTEVGVQWGQEFLCTNGYAFRWSATSRRVSRAKLVPSAIVFVLVFPVVRL